MHNSCPRGPALDAYALWCGSTSATHTYCILYRVHLIKQKFLHYAGVLKDMQYLSCYLATCPGCTLPLVLRLAVHMDQMEARFGRTIEK